jgi:endoglucanase
MFLTTKLYRLLLAVVAVLILGLGFVPGHAARPLSDAAARTVLRSMGAGINILGYDGLWDGHANAPFRLEWLKTIRQAGFRHVRINLHAFRYLDANNRLDPQLLPRLDKVITAVVAAGLVPVVDEHDFDGCSRAPESCERRLVAFWSAMGAYFANRHPTLVFELLNEPGGNITQQQWNNVSQRLISLLRASNPRRTLIVAVLNVEDAGQIEQLQLPADDRNLIVTFHYYKPFNFTHQGAPWSPTVAALKNVRWGSPADLSQMAADFDVVAKWAQANNRPVYLGEFSAYNLAPSPDRARYIGCVARLAEQRGWSWAYWQFDHDFNAFSTDTASWIPEILQALRPQGRSSGRQPGRSC